MAFMLQTLWSDQALDFGAFVILLLGFLTFLGFRNNLAPDDVFADLYDETLE